MYTLLIGKGQIQITYTHAIIIGFGNCFRQTSISLYWYHRKKFRVPISMVPFSNLTILISVLGCNIICKRRRAELTWRRRSNKQTSTSDTEYWGWTYSPGLYLFTYTLWCRYNAVNFHPNPHKRHPIASLQKWGVGCLVRVHPLIKFGPSHCSAVYNMMLYIDCIITALGYIYP